MQNLRPMQREKSKKQSLHQTQGGSRRLIARENVERYVIELDEG